MNHVIYFYFQSHIGSFIKKGHAVQIDQLKRLFLGFHIVTSIMLILIEKRKNNENRSWLIKNLNNYMWFDSIVNYAVQIDQLKQTLLK